MLSDFWSSIYIVIRPLIKWFLHRFTNLCELQVRFEIEASQFFRFSYIFFSTFSEFAMELILVQEERS